MIGQGQALLGARSEAHTQCVSDEQRRKAPAMDNQRGGLAQLGEHLLCKQGVVGSIPSSSTNNFGLVLSVCFTCYNF